MSLGSGTGAAGSLKGEAAVLEPTRHERAVARRSAEIRATVPHAEFTTVVAMDAALTGAASAQVPTFSVVLAAVAAALAATPRLNGSYRDGRMERYPRVNIGVTIAAEGLYVLPTIFDSDAKSVTELASELADYRERALQDRLESAELTGATFSVTDLSEHGIVAGAPLVVGGHAGALSVGAVRAVPVVADGAVVPGHELILTLAVDHRIVQAPDAGAFLTEVRTRLEAA